MRETDLRGTMAEYGIHKIDKDTLCDFCGKVCDAEVHELNQLTCTYSLCPEGNRIFHQDCVEKHLKGLKLER